MYPLCRLHEKSKYFQKDKNETENHFSHYPRSQGDINLYTRLKIAMSLIANFSARLAGKSARQGCRANLSGKAAGKGCRARLNGKVTCMQWHNMLSS
jgi:hypothetical protein